MRQVRLTVDNVHQFIGHIITFTSRKRIVHSRLRRVSPSGKTLYIDHDDLGSNIVIGRKIFVTIP